MHQIEIPILPISERTTWGELPELLDAFFTHCEEQGNELPPLLLFEPLKVSRIPGDTPSVSEVPATLLVVAVEMSVREAVFQALERVEKREPIFPNAGAAKPPQFKDNTPLKSFYRQMTEMPATVFSVTFPDDGPDAISIFFLRTAFTVTEFRREIQQPIG